MVHGGETVHLRAFLRRFRHRAAPGAKPRRPAVLGLLLCIGLLMAFLASAGLYLRGLSTQIAVSDAGDVVSAEVNRVIAQVMGEERFAADSFVRFEKNGAGEVTAVSSDMGRINALSAEILERVVGSATNRTLTVRIPLGNLSGVNLLMGRGPAVPVEILMLTSSRVGFDSGIVTAGINQTRHQILLTVTVDIDVLVPWGTESTQVKSQVLIADTIVVGKVPGTYMSIES